MGCHPPYVVAELTAGFTMAAYAEQRDEETTELRRLLNLSCRSMASGPPGATAEAILWMASRCAEEECFTAAMAAPSISL